MNIENLIGATTKYDKKRLLKIKKPESWCKSVSSLANSSGIGGTLIFCIVEDNEILDNPEKDAEIISEQIKKRLNRIPEFNLRFYNTEGKKVLIILNVYAGDQTPYYYDADGSLVAYHRDRNQSIPVSNIKLKELVLKGSLASFDSLDSKYDFAEMSFTKLKSVYKQRTGDLLDYSDFKSFGIVNKDKN